MVVGSESISSTGIVCESDGDVPHGQHKGTDGTDRTGGLGGRGTGGRRTTGGATRKVGGTGGTGGSAEAGAGSCDRGTGMSNNARGRGQQVYSHVHKAVSCLFWCLTTPGEKKTKIESTLSKEHTVCFQSRLVLSSEDLFVLRFFSRK